MAITGWSGFWNNTGPTVGTYSFLTPLRGPLDRAIGRVLKRRSNIRLREVIDTVVAGSSINGAAAVTYQRVKAVPSAGVPVSGGGKVDIETVTVIPGASSTTAADAAQVDAIVAFSNAPSSYPVDLSGNGGGGDLTKPYRAGS